MADDARAALATFADAARRASEATAQFARVTDQLTAAALAHRADLQHDVDEQR